MKIKFLVVVLLSVAMNIFASNVSVKGVVVDADDQTPLDYVNVTLFKAGSKTPVSGVVTDKSGTFILPSVNNGKYTLRITYVGYSSVNKQIEVAGKPLTLGTIQLNEDAKKLGEVEVVGQGSQMKFDIDKKVFSVDQNISAAGGSASDVLKNIPSVTVDNQGNVSLRKDGNVEVWINGKASGLTADNRAQVLQQMPAESIESIEIMTNPSAKYSPEGSAGIINLVMKKQRKAGYFGSLSAGLVYPDGGALGTSLGASVNYSSSKVDAYLNLGYRAMSFQGGAETDRKNWVNGNDTTRLSQNSTSTMAFSGLFFRTGIDYHINATNTISLSGFGMAGSGTQTNNTHNTFQNIMTNPATLISDFDRNNTSVGGRPSLNLNLDYKLDFDKKGSNLLASLSYSDHIRSGNSQYVQTYNDNLGHFNSDVNQNAVGEHKEYQFKVDYTNKLTETSKLEAGWQSTLTDRLSTSTGYDNLKKEAIAPYFDAFRYQEQIHAGYLTYGNRIDKFSYQLGLRAELLSKSSSDTSRTSYSVPVDVKDVSPSTNFHLFPSFYLSYSLPENNELQLNLTNRVNRPRGNNINPYKNYADSTNITYGNPELSPEYSYALELNYIKTWDTNTFSASAYYHYTDNVIENIRFANKNGVMKNTWTNISKFQNTGLELISKNRLFRILSLTSTLNIYYSKLDSATYINPDDVTEIAHIQQNSSFSWSANIMANFMLSKTFSGQITAEYESPEVIAQGYKSAKYSIDFGVRQTFLDRKLSLSLNVRDLLNSDRERTITSGTGFSQNAYSYFHGRMVMLTLNYNFGNMKPKPADMKKMQNSGGDMMDNGE